MSQQQENLNASLTSQNNTDLEKNDKNNKSLLSSAYNQIRKYVSTK